MKTQPVDLYQPIIHTRVGPPPLTLRTVITPTNGNLEGGTQVAQKVEQYVLLSALPAELQERVKTAIQMLSII